VNAIKSGVIGVGSRILYIALDLRWVFIGEQQNLMI